MFNLTPRKGYAFYTHNRIRKAWVRLIKDTSLENKIKKIDKKIRFFVYKGIDNSIFILYCSELSSINSSRSTLSLDADEILLSVTERFLRELEEDF